MDVPPIFRVGLPFRIQRQATRTWTDMRAVSSRTTLRGHNRARARVLEPTELGKLGGGGVAEETCEIEAQK